MALHVCRRLLQELNQPHCQIFSPNKNQYHQNPDRLNKSYLDQPYSITKLLTVALEKPDRVQIEYNKKGKHSGTKIEKKFDVPIGFLQTSGYYPFPMCSIIKFELDPATQSKYYSDGKPTILMRYTLTEDYILKNVTGKVFHHFTNSPLPNHADCFYDMQKHALNRNRKNPIKIYKYCNLPNCTCKPQLPPPQPTPPYQPHTNQPPANPIPSTILDWEQAQNQGGAPSWDWGQTQNEGGAPSWDWGQAQNQGGAPSWDWRQAQNQGGAPSWDWGQVQNQGGAPSWDWGQAQNKGGAQCGDREKPKTKEVPNVGTGEKPKRNDVPKVGMGEIPIVPFKEPPTKKHKI